MMISILPIQFVEIELYHKVAILIINFVFGSLLLAVFNHNRFRDHQSRLFVGMGISMLLWVDFAYSARLIGYQNPLLSQFFLKIAWVATPPTFYFTYLTSLLVMRKDDERGLEKKILLFLTCTLSILTAFSNFIIDGTVYRGNNLDIIYGSGFLPFLFVIALLMFTTIRPLVHTKLNASARMFLFGVTLFYILNLIFNITLPVVFRLSYLYFLGDYSTILLLACTSYAILRHELFEIKIVTTEAITGILWVVLFSKIFISELTHAVLIDVLTLVLAVLFGILLIRSVIREVEQRQRLEVLSKKLKELDIKKDEFLSIAAHELRAPMTAIKGYLSMILDGDAGKLTNEAKLYLTGALDGNDRLIRLVNNMLNISRIEEGRMVYQMGEVQLSKVIKTVTSDFSKAIEEKGLSLIVNISSGIKDSVYVDQDRIYEVFSNFINNAVKYTEKGSVCINVTNTENNQIRVEIQDTGPGISQEEQKKLFQKFARTKVSEGKVMGTGLGLYVSKLLIERFKGKLGIISQEGSGSIFWFELPLSGSVN